MSRLGAINSNTNISMTGGGQGVIPSVPEVGNFYITNLTVDAQGLLVVEYEDNPGASSVILSQPVAGNFAVTNLTIENGKLKVEYDN